MEPAKTGDIVYLKSGSPAMTVEGPDTSDAGKAEKRYYCVWFVGTEKKSYLFSLAMLTYTKPVPEREKGHDPYAE